MNLRTLLTPAIGMTLLATAIDGTSAAVPQEPRSLATTPRQTQPNRVTAPATTPPTTQPKSGVSTAKPPVKIDKSKQPSRFIGGSGDGESI